jgi:hypothetical protein
MNPDRNNGLMRTPWAGHAKAPECGEINCNIISEKEKKKSRVREKNQFRKPE